MQGEEQHVLLILMYWPLFLLNVIQVHLFAVDAYAQLDILVSSAK